MTSHFNLPTFDLYNISGLQNQLSQQQKFQQQQQQRYQQVEVVEAIPSNTFADTTHFITSTTQQHAAATAAQLAYVQQIPSSYIYNTTSYPSPPLDSSVTFPSTGMDTPTDSVDHHHNDSKTYHGIITSPPPFTNDLRDHKPHINTTDSYPTSSYVLILSF